jgi:hypothetical protein
VLVFVGDDWAEDHDDVHLMDEAGTRLAARRLPEGAVGIGGLHALIAEHATDPGQVVVGIETDRGLWAGALSAPAIRCSRSTRSPPSATANATSSRGRSPIPGSQGARRSGAHRPTQSPPRRRGQHRFGGGQDPGPCASEPDLVTHPEFFKVDESSGC